MKLKLLALFFSLFIISHFTMAQIVLVKDISPGPSASGLSEINNRFVKFDNHIYFSAVETSNWGLYKSDGSNAGTVRVTNPADNIFIKELSSTGVSISTGAFLGWSGNYYSATGERPWTSDGVIANIASTITNYVQTLFVHKGEIYFSGHTFAEGFELWKIDISKNAAILKSLPGVGINNSLSPSNFVSHSDGNLYFLAWVSNSTCALWKTDGTTVGTVKVKDMPYASKLYSAGANLFVFAPNTPPGYYDPNKLWVSDGTTVGTVIIKDFNPTGYPYHTHAYSFNNKLYFSLNDDINGQELWRSDGTTIGTAMVSNLNPGPASGNSIPVGHIGSALYLSATDGINSGLFKMDASTESISFVKQLQTIATGVQFQGKLYFGADDGILGQELWRTDGTAAGTINLGDISATGGSYPQRMIELNGQLLFTAYTDDLYYELYKYTDPDVPPCLTNRQLVGNPQQAFYGASASINSYQTLFYNQFNPLPPVVYNAPAICLFPGFVAEAGTVFTALPINGCTQN